MKRAIFTIAFSLACPAALWAEEVGQINADLDGEARQWFTISVKQGERKALSASFRNDNRLPTLSLQGHPEPRYSSADVLSVTASWFGAYDPAKSPVSVEIIFMPEGMSKPFYTSDQVAESPTLTVDMMEWSDDTGRATGSFSGKICLVPKLYEAPNLDDCKTVSGTFDTAIQVR
ncbi:MAG: hypothetical protein WBS20_04755 [Lysobacterales bacterium]